MLSLSTGVACGTKEIFPERFKNDENLLSVSLPTVETVGVLVGLYLTLIFTIPYVNANPGNFPIISSFVSFPLVHTFVITETMIFAYIVPEVNIRK